MLAMIRTSWYKETYHQNGITLAMQKDQILFDHLADIVSLNQDVVQKMMLQQ
jgi:hypothetical protein